MSDHTPGIILAWQIAASETAHAQHEFIEPEYLFIGLCKLEYFAAVRRLRRLELGESEIASLKVEIESLLGLFSRFGLDPTALRREMRQRKGSGVIEMSDRPERVVHRSPQSRQVFARAGELARATDAPVMTVFHLLAALLDDPDGAIALWLREKGVDVAALKDAALATTLPSEGGTLLSRYGKDLTQLARQGKIHAAIGRKAEILQIVRTLSRATKNNPLLLGEAGVGKTAIVEGLAYRIAQGNVTQAVRGKRIVQINLADLVAGTKYRGQFEERLQGLVRDVAAAPDVILFIDEIHTVVGAGKVGGALDAANILKPALARGDLRCIGATTLAEYRKYIEKDPALERRFQPVTVDEPTVEETIEILEGIQSRFAEQHGVTIAGDALPAAATLTAKYVPDRRLPDKAIDALDEACARVQITRLTISPDESAPPQGGGTVAAEAVAEVVAEWTGIPLAQLTEDERDRLLRMAEILKERVVGQDDAVQAVAQAVQRARAGLKPAGRPTGVLLFLGPTGVGKTELARATAAFLFGSDEAMTRLDMSEFQEKHTVSRLVGAPPGYVGYEEEGQLTGALRRKPFCVVLLDEIEKAHPDVLNLFLQVFDNGRLTDAKGRTVDATNALFIMTSNIGYKHQVGFRPHDSDVDRQALFSEVESTLRPEFLGRIDETIIFHSLARQDIVGIARLLLRDLRKRLDEHGIGLEVNEAAVALLARLGYDDQYGARPLRRVIEQQVANPVGGMLLRDEARAGHIVVVNARGDEIEIGLLGRETM